jgi:hypothetical protein
MVFLWIESGYMDWLFCIRQTYVLFMSGLMTTLPGALYATHLPVIYHFPHKLQFSREGKLAHNWLPIAINLVH